MNKALILINESIRASQFISIIFSSPRDKSLEIKNINVSKKSNNELKKEIRYIKHNDIKSIELEDLLTEIQSRHIKDFKQILIKTTKSSFQILLNKKFASKVIETRNKIIIPEAIPVDIDEDSVIIIIVKKAGVA